MNSPNNRTCRRRLLGFPLLVAAALAAGCSPQRHADAPGPVPAPSPPATFAAATTPPPAWSPAPIQADASELRLTLAQAVLLCFQRDSSLQVRTLDPRIAAEAIALPRAAFDPQLQLDAQRAQDRSSSPQTTISTPEGPIAVAESSSSSRIDTYSAQLNQLLPTGTQLSLGVATVRQIIDDQPPFFTTRPFASITQALLQGASLSANLASLRIARLQLDISRYEFRGFAESLLAQLEDAYWDLDLAQRRIDIVRAALAAASAQSDDDDERIRVGRMAESERAAARAEVAARQQDLIDARSDAERARLAFLRLVGPGNQAWWERPVTILTPAERMPDDAVQPPSDHLILALALRPDLNQARLQAASGELSVIQTRDGLLPQLSFFATLGSTGYGADVAHSFHYANGQSYDLTFGLQGTISLLERAQRGELPPGAALTRPAAPGHPRPRAAGPAGGAFGGGRGRAQPRADRRQPDHHRTARAHRGERGGQARGRAQHRLLGGAGAARPGQQPAR